MRILRVSIFLNQNQKHKLPHADQPGLQAFPFVSGYILLGEQERGEQLFARPIMETPARPRQATRWYYFCRKAKPVLFLNYIPFTQCQLQAYALCGSIRNSYVRCYPGQIANKLYIQSGDAMFTKQLEGVQLTQKKMYQIDGIKLTHLMPCFSV